MWNPQRHRPFLATSDLLIIAAATLGIGAPAILRADEAVTYEAIAPILARQCVVCHSGPNAAANLKLDSLDTLLKGGRNGPIVTAGSPEASELIRRLKGSSQPRMPMTGPPFLAASEIDLFERWIKDGLQPGQTVQTTVAAPLSRPEPGERVTYQHVAPIFATRCARCHTAKGLMGAAPEGYRLTSYKATLTTHDRVRVVPGMPKASELLRRIRGQSRPPMPLDGPPWLSAEEIQLIEDWITQGARDANGNMARFPHGARIRLHGTLDPQWQLDGLPLKINTNTRIRKSASPGDYVRVRGRLNENGEIEVERLRRR